MELADPRLLQEIMAFQNRAPRRRVGAQRRKTRPEDAAPVYRTPIHKSARCRCGKCASCMDNARWERIFAEKFADPYYYSGLAIRHQSPLRTL
jgi:hypothetical protein